MDGFFFVHMAEKREGGSSGKGKMSLLHCMLGTP
jgi:hypothetical protein